MLPSLDLPRSLNPVYIEYENAEQIPLVWYGVPYDGDSVQAFAFQEGYAIMDPTTHIYNGEAYWENLVVVFYKYYGIHLAVRRVWGCKEGVLAFFSNRDLAVITKKQHRVVQTTLLQLGCEKAKWYLDRDDDTTRSSSNQDEISFNSAWFVAPVSAHGSRESIVKEPLKEFVFGDPVVRDIMPSPELPRCLNPIFVEYERVEQIPRVWYGVPYDSDIVRAFALQEDYALLDPTTYTYSAVKSWHNWVEMFYKFYGLPLSVRRVWGYEGKLIAFFSNRDLAMLTKKQYRVVQNTLVQMGYSHEAKWYLDKAENL